MNIRWGKIVDSLSGVDAATSAGFSHVQLTVDSIMNLDDEQFLVQKEYFRKNKILPEVCSSPLPPDVHVTEMGFNLYVWLEYLRKATRRIAALGCRKLAWSNGRSRVLPWEGDIMGVKEQVLQFLYMLCDVSAEHSIIVLLEPLGPLRTNFLNSMEEIEDFLPRVGKDNLSSMISLRELSEIGIPIEKLETFSDLITHVQLENPTGKTSERIPPLPGDGSDYRPFLKALREMNYDGMISLPQDAGADSLHYCRNIWDNL